MSELYEANILRSLVFFHVGNLSPSCVNLHIYISVCSHTYIYTAIAYLQTFSELFMRDILNFDSSASCFMQAVDAPLTSEVGKFVTTWDTLASPQLWQGLLLSLAGGSTRCHRSPLSPAEHTGLVHPSNWCPAPMATPDFCSLSRESPSTSAPSLTPVALSCWLVEGAVWRMDALCQVLAASDSLLLLNKAFL